MAEQYSDATESMVNIVHDLIPGLSDQGQEASSSTFRAADYLPQIPKAKVVVEDGIYKNVQDINSEGQVKNFNEFLETESLPSLHINKESQVRAICHDHIKTGETAQIKGSEHSLHINKESEVCAICHDHIKMEEAAQIKGCEHKYCVTCILRWATYKTEPWCPQCRLPFNFLYVYKALDGTLADYMFEESVCLLLRASWFKPLIIQELDERDDYQDDYDVYEECYYTSNLRLGNRRWGDTGFVRGGRREARPVSVRQVVDTNNGGSSRQAKGKEPVKEAVGRRARRTQKRQQSDKKMAAEH